MNQTNLTNTTKQFKLIDDVLFKKSISMDTPTFNMDLGTAVYFASRYFHSGELEIKTKAEKLLNSFIDKFSFFEYNNGILTGFEGVFWALNFIENCNININSTELLSDIEPELIKSIEFDFLDSNFELYYGFIGKLQYFLKDKTRIKVQKVKELLDNSIKSLWNSKLQIDDKYYWLDKERGEKEEIVDLGIAHGILGVFMFLTRLKELGFKNPILDKLTIGVLKTILSSTNKIKVDSVFPDIYSINTKNKHLNYYNSRLGFCTGDLPIAYSLFYYGNVTNDEEILDKAKIIIDSIIKRDIANSSLLHLHEYGFFDIGFCHGISSILFMLSRISKWYKNEKLEKRVLYWKNELIKNTNKLLSINTPIKYSSRYNKFDMMFELEKCSFLEGICASGLILTAIESNDYKIGNFLNLY